MNVKRFLTIAVPVVAIPAFMVLFLPEGIWTRYVDIIEPLSLFIGALLALYVSFLYRKQLKIAFLFLSAFLFIYMLAIVLFLSFSPILLPYLQTRLGESEIFSLVQSIQFTNYAMLFLFCINILRVVDVARLNRTGWFLFVLVIVYCILAAIYPRFELIKNISSLQPFQVSHLVMRLFDAALIIVLAPVLWLYVQHLKSHQRQSLTFTVVIFGIICATLFDYLFELVLTISPNLLVPGSRLLATIPEVFFIYGYLIIAVGLYAHRKQDDWGYNIVDKITSGELKLIDEKLK